MRKIHYIRGIPVVLSISGHQNWYHIWVNYAGKIDNSRSRNTQFYAAEAKKVLGGLKRMFRNESITCKNYGNEYWRRGNGDLSQSSTGNELFWISIEGVSSSSLLIKGLNNLFEAKCKKTVTHPSWLGLTVDSCR